MNAPKKPSDIELALRNNLRQLAKKNRYEKIMNIVARSVHQSIKFEEVLENSVEAMSKNIDGVENVSIYMIEGKEAVIKAWRGYTDYYIKHAGRIRYPKGATWKTIIDGQPRYVKDVDTDAAIGAAGRKIGVKSYVTMPIKYEDETKGVLIISSYARDVFDKEELKLLKSVGQQIEIAINNARQAQELEKALTELEQLKNRLQEENDYLHEEIKTDHNFNEIIGESDTLKALLKKVELVAPTDATVLIQGETGTGKELVARSIHDLSPRHANPFVKVNCGAISQGLFESELFGHEKGSFTSAIQKRTGRFELADKGTIFLDEIGELPLETQVKLLRVLQEKTYERVGGSKSLTTDSRVIAATNRDLTEAIHNGTFRKDLYFRLNVFPLELPPLRHRTSDIPALANFFINKYSRKLGKQFAGISKDSIDRLKQYEWPGNIRELQNVIERAIILARGSTLIIDGSQLKFNTDKNAKDSIKLEDVEREHLIDVINKTNWVIEGNRGAANMLGLKPSTLRYRLQKLGIKRA